MPRHIVLKNKRTRLKKKKNITKVVMLTFIFSVFFGGVVWGAYNKQIRISNVYISGNTVVLSKSIKKEVNKLLSEKYFWILPKDNIFIYPKQQIKKEILDIFNRIYRVNIGMIDTNSIKILVMERSPFALWCGNSLYKDDRDISDKCYFLDKTGFIFTQAPNFSDDVYFEFYGKIDTGILGKQFLPKKEFARVVFFRDSLDDANIKINKFSIAKNGDYLFRIDNSDKTTILFNKSQDFKKTFYNLKSAVDVKSSEMGTKDIFKNLKYIDLRFKNKVLFKY